MSYPFTPRQPGRAGFTPDLAPDAAEIPVVRRVRREVAERLTATTRAHESAMGEVMSPQEQQATTRRLITEALDGYATAEMNAGRPPLRPDAESRVARSVADMLLGAGGLQPLLNDERVEDIHANGCDQVFVRYTNGRRVQVAPIADTDAEVVELIRRLAADAGRAETGGEGGEERRWDRAAPILKLQLPDGSRLHAIMSVTPRPALSIRRHHYIKVTLADLEQLGTVNPVLRELLAAAVRARLNTLAAGRTGAGKTTLLRALATNVDPRERIVTIEDTYELALNADKALHPDVVPLQSREANVEGEGAIGMSELFRSGLRMSPDRVIVGEIRGHEVIPMLNAMSQGNDGSLGTIHASSSAGTFKKLVLYAAQAPERLDPATTNLLVAESVHLVVHLALADAGRRVVTSVREVVDADGLSVSSNEIFRPGPDGRAVPAAPPSTRLLDTLARAGFDPGLLDEARTAPGGVDDMTVPLAALLGLGTAFGAVLIALGLFGRDDGPADSDTESWVSRFTSGRGPVDRRRVAVCVAVGVLVAVVTRWPVAAVLCAIGVWVLPAVIGPDRGHARRVARIDAIATWTEALRDNLSGAAGLEQAITTSAIEAPEPIRDEVTRLATRLQRSWRLTAALRAFAAELADPTADLVVAGLLMAARGSAGQLGEVLGELAASARAKVASRQRIAASRKSNRTSARVIVGVTLAMAGFLTLANRGYLAPFDTATGQLVLLAAGGCFGFAFFWLAKLMRDRDTARVLQNVTGGIQSQAVVRS